MKAFIVLFAQLVLVYGISDAQDLYNGTGLFVTGGALHVPGTVTNDGYIQNNGTVTLEGDWINKNTYNGRGTVLLQGVSEQHVFNHNQPMAQLHVNASGGKWIGDELLLTEKLTLEEGVINFEGLGKLQLADKVSIHGGSETSYVNGPLTHEGTGYKFYPVGKNNKYRPLELLDIHGIAPVTTMELMEDAPPLTVPLCEEIFGKLYWQRTTVSGTFDSSPLSIAFDEADVTSQQRLVIIQSEGFDKEFTPLEIDNITANGRDGKISSAGASGKIFLLASRQRPPVINNLTITSRTSFLPRPATP